MIYLFNQFLRDEQIYNNVKFLKEIEEYKKLNINVENAYDFYSSIASSDFENEIKDILGEINLEEKEKSIKEKQEKREEERKKMEEKIEKNEEIKPQGQDFGDDDIDELEDL